MDFSVKIEGLQGIEQATQRVRDAVASELNKAVYAGALQVEKEAKLPIMQGNKSGRIYKRRTVEHRASAPGEAPANDTGRLVNSITSRFNSVKGGEAFVYIPDSTVKYAKWLEFGTHKIAPRPFFFPAFEKSKAWIKDRLAEGVRRGLEKGKK